MNFASWPFLALFLPVVLGGFFLIRDSEMLGRRQAWLIASSLLFYGVSGLSNLGLLVASMAVNFTAGAALASDRFGRRTRRALMWGAVLADLGALVAYKWLALGSDAVDGFLSGPDILIPLALSFITFQQIGFVVACYRRRIERPTLFDYLFFVSFFPQLILGPIVRYGHISGQLKQGALGSAGSRDVAIGLAIFVFGLAKKVLIADQLALPVNAVFDGALAGAQPSTAEAWFGAIGFQFQLFMDFSAYAAMAIGLGRMFGIALPINFDEPYKAVDRFDLWRRWHITFVVFMRTHVFVPLVRHWKLPTGAAIVVTAVLSGLWHGLGWTFVIWGLVQAALLLGIHWRTRRWRRTAPRRGLRLVWAIAATFLLTCVIGALFRAPTLESAQAVYGALFGLAGDGPRTAPVQLRDLIVFAAAAAAIWVLPSGARLFGPHWNAHDPRPEKPRRAVAELLPLRFALDRKWAAAMALLVILAFFYLGETQRFVYAQF